MLKIIYHLHVTCSRMTEFTEAKIRPLSSSDLILVNVILWGTLQQKLYRRETRGVDQLLLLKALMVPTTLKICCRTTLRNCGTELRPCRRHRSVRKHGF